MIKNLIIFTQLIVILILVGIEFDNAHLTDMQRIEYMEELSQGKTIILNADIANIDSLQTSPEFEIAYSSDYADTKNSCLQIKHLTRENYLKDWK